MQTASGPQFGPQSNRSAVWIHNFAVERQLSQHAQGLGRKSFIKFKPLHVLGPPIGTRKQFADSWDRPDTHSSRVNASLGKPGNTGQGLPTVGIHSLF